MRIGLIAMSGVRACDPELLRMGLTLPGFVERGRTVAALPSLGLLTLAGMTPSEHEICYREVRDVEANPPEALEPFDLVAISTFTAQAYEAYALADRYRESGAMVVMGGLHVTSLPEEAAEHCDSVVIGEGEVCWPEVLADVQQRSLQPFYRSQPREFDLSTSPMPAFHLLEIERYNRLTVQTERGCPWRCEFCASSVVLTPRYKQKPASRVLAEVDAICRRWPRPFIEFADDNSMVDKRYWKRLLPELALRGIRWFTETDISVAEDEELLSLMRASGCAEVLIGLESPVDAGLAGLETKVDWKRRQLPRYRDAVQRIQSHGIRVNGCFILGLDGQTPSIFDEVYRAVQELALFDVQITVQTPFPGTPLYARLRDEGRLLEEAPWEKCTLFDVTYTPSHMTVEELRAGFRDLAQRLYSEDFTHRRHQQFADQYLRNRRHRTAVAS